MNRTVRLINNAGGCLVSTNILNKKGKLKWCFRQTPINDTDNGWRFLSDIDDEEFINDPQNMKVCDYNTVANIEPAALMIYSLPVGTDIYLDKGKDGTMCFRDSKTHIRID